MSSSTDFAGFASRVQALPAELYNEIYALTFASADGEHHINRDSRPPSYLQVDRSTRKRLLLSYYGAQSTFYVQSDILYQWIRSLPDLDVRDPLTNVNHINYYNCRIRYARARSQHHTDADVLRLSALCGVFGVLTPGMVALPHRIARQDWNIEVYVMSPDDANLPWVWERAHHAILRYRSRQRIAFSFLGANNNRLGWG